MTKKKNNSDQLVELTKEIFHQSFQGDFNLWFSHLNKDSIYMGSGNPILLGSTAIKNHFDNLQGFCHGEIINEDYIPNAISSSVYCINGKIKLRGNNTNYTATTYFTITYKMVNDIPVIVQQHNSYEFRKELNGKNRSLLETNKSTMEFMQNIILRQSTNERIQIKNNSKTIFTDPCTIFYIQSTDKSSEFICIDRIITSTERLKDIANKLPDYFYQIHRSFIVNTKYIVAMRRFEVELLSGEILPIPEKSYTKIRTILKAKMNVTNC